ncbi:cytochrome c3 family protein [Desulfuromonas versatilis]|nr:cytochrome c3 family protein [Desulfuromonas versatilis]
MKRLLLSALLLTLTAAPSLAGTAPGTGVVGSLHDMNTISGATDDPQARVCAFCHTPHHAMADPTGEQQPLWSHQYTSYISNWTPYASPTFQGGDNWIDPLMGPSRLCMSCHDGLVAVDQHYGMAGTKTGLGGDGWGGRDIGLADAGGNADFSNDHPIGFSYNDAQTNDIGQGLFAASGRQFLSNTNNAALTVEDVLLYGDIMTCATCHDVHNKDNANNTAAPGRNYFVYAPQDNSALCLTCHNKGNGVDEF